MASTFQRVQRELKSGNPSLSHQSASASDSVASEVESAVVPADHCHTQPPPQASAGGKGPLGCAAGEQPTARGGVCEDTWSPSLQRDTGSPWLPPPRPHHRCSHTGQTPHGLPPPPEALGLHCREGPQHPRGQFSSRRGCRSPHLTVLGTPVPRTLSEHHLSFPFLLLF